MTTEAPKSKLQVPSSKALAWHLPARAWNLVLPWNLELGIWSFGRRFRPSD